MKARAAAAIGLGVLVFAAAAYAEQSQRKPGDTDIVVEGQPTLLRGGDWTLKLSRAFTFGSAYNRKDLRPIGADKMWHICLAAAEAEPLIRVLVGEGQTPSATAQCSRLQVRLGGGKVNATQSCYGTTMMPSDPESGRATVGLGTGHNGIGVAGPSTQIDRNRPMGQEPPVRARDTLSVSGRYSGSSLRLNFANVQEPEMIQATLSGPPLRNERRWSITGQRQGDCAGPVSK